MIVKEKTYNKRKMGVVVLKPCIQDSKTSSKDAIINVKRIANIKKNEQISIASDAVFKTMLANSKRKKYACKLLSLLLGISFDELIMQ